VDSVVNYFRKSFETKIANGFVRVRFPVAVEESVANEAEIAREAQTMPIRISTYNAENFEAARNFRHLATACGCGYPGGRPARGVMDLRS
jgi:hypothetical protein